RAHHKPVARIIDELVWTYIASKLKEKSKAVALYKIASDVEGEFLVSKASVRIRNAVAEALRESSGSPPKEIEFAVSIFVAALAAATRQLLETGARVADVEQYRQHLTMLGRAYFSALQRPSTSAENATSRCASIAASRWARAREMEL